MITCGSLFAGIGGFELGAQWAFESAGIPHKVLFQVEQNKFCQKILNKHWPAAQLFDDVRAVGRHNLPQVDILMGGFPCTDISQAGNQKGIINGEKSSLWFEMERIISELRPAIVVLENVPAIVRVGGPVVIGGLTKIGYDCEWQVISAAQFGAPHLRERWFCVATDTNSDRSDQAIDGRSAQVGCDGPKIQQRGFPKPANTDRTRNKRGCKPNRVRAEKADSNKPIHPRREIASRWEKFPSQPPLRRRDDGISNRLARLRALGNAIVPQCSKFIFDHIIENILQSQQHKQGV